MEDTVGTDNFMAMVEDWLDSADSEKPLTTEEYFWLARQFGLF